MRKQILASALALALMPACVTMTPAQQAAHEQQLAASGAYGRDYCPERLPAAQEHIEVLYERASQSSRSDVITTDISAPGGEHIHVSVASDESGAILSEGVQTGLSDLLLNCGATFSDNECFVDLYIDGQPLASLSPGTEGQVGFRCLLAGRRQLRVESVATVLFDGEIDLVSDHEHILEIKESGVRIYAVNPIAGRIPPVPTRANTAQGSSGSLALGVGSGGTAVGATVTRGDASAPSVGVSSEAETRSSFDEERVTQTRDEGFGRGRGHRTERYDEQRTQREDEARTSSTVTIGPPASTPARTTTTTTTTTTRGARDERGRRAARVEAIRDADFTQLQRDIEGESFEQGKVGMVKMAAASNHFTADQARQLVRLMPFSGSKVEAAVLLHPQVVDQNNFTRVLSALDFDRDRAEVRKRLGF